MATPPPALPPERGWRLCSRREPGASQAPLKTGTATATGRDPHRPEEERGPGDVGTRPRAAQQTLPSSSHPVSPMRGASPAVRGPRRPHRGLEATGSAGQATRTAGPPVRESHAATLRARAIRQPGPAPPGREAPCPVPNVTSTLTDAPPQPWLKQPVQAPLLS